MPEYVTLRMTHYEAAELRSHLPRAQQALADAAVGATRPGEVSQLGSARRCLSRLAWKLSPDNRTWDYEDELTLWQRCYALFRIFVPHLPPDRARAARLMALHLERRIQRAEGFAERGER